MRRLRTTRPSFRAALCFAALASTARAVAQPLALERITPDNAARIEPVARVGRLLRGVRVTGDDGLWMHASDGLYRISREGAARRVSAEVDLTMADAALAGGELVFSTGQFGDAALHLVDPAGRALVEPARLSDAPSAPAVSRAGSVVATWSHGEAAVFEADVAHHAWRARRRFRVAMALPRGALSRDGARLALYDGRRVAVYDTLRGALVASSPEPRSWCGWQREACPDRSAPVDTRWLDVCVADDGRVMAAGGSRVAGVPGAHRVDVFTVGRGARAVAELAGTLERARFSPDCARLAAVVRDGDGRTSLQTLDVASGEALGLLALEEASVQVEWAPTGRAMIVSDARRLRVWTPGEEDRDASVRADAMGALWSPTGDALDVTAFPAAARVWLQETMLGPSRFGALLPPRSDLSVSRGSADGRVAVFGRRRAITVVDLAGAAAPRTLPLPYTPTYLALHPQGSEVAVLNPDGDVELRALTDGAVRLALHPTRARRFVQWSRDGAFVVVAQSAPDGALRPSAWRARDGVAAAQPPDGAWRAVSEWPGGSAFALTGERSFALWSPATNRVVAMPFDPAASVQPSGDGAVACWIRRGADGATTGVATRTSDGATLREVVGAGTCALSYDGAYAVWRVGRAAVVMSLRDGVSHTLSGDAGAWLAAAVSPDGALVAMQTFDGWVLRGVANDRELSRVRSDPGEMSFSPDGTLLVRWSARSGRSAVDTAEIWAVPTQGARGSGGALVGDARAMVHTPGA